MGKQKDKIILGVIITSAACYIGNKIWNYYYADKDIIKKAKAAMLENKIQDAIGMLKSIKSPDYEATYLLYECHYKLGNMVNALNYLNICISLELKEDAIEARHVLHNTLGMYKEAFKDLFLINLLNDEEKTKKERATDFLKKICIKFAKSHKVEGFASKINYSDFFDTLFFLKDVKDPVVVFLNSREYEKCYDLVSGSEDPFHRFIYGCFYLVNGDHHYACKIFEESSFEYSKLIINFIKSKKLNVEEIKKIREGIEHETDITKLFYYAKIFDNIGDKETQFHLLSKIQEISPNSTTACSLIVWHIKQQKYAEAEDLIKKSLTNFSDSAVLFCIALEYYLDKKDIPEATRIFEKAEALFPDDPRIFYFKYEINAMIGDRRLEILEKGIQLDPKYFKLYIYLGNDADSSEKTLLSYKNALKCARGFDEIYMAYQLLIVVETQNELLKEHPSFFKKFVERSNL